MRSSFICWVPDLKMCAPSLRRLNYDPFPCSIDSPISSIRLSLPCVLGIKHVVHQCDETRAALLSEVEKLNIKLHYFGESGRVTASLASRHC
jgi:hypothetical protein